MQVFNAMKLDFATAKVRELTAEQLDDFARYLWATHLDMSDGDPERPDSYHVTRGRETSDRITEEREAWAKEPEAIRCRWTRYADFAWLKLCTLFGTDCWGIGEPEAP